MSQQTDRIARFHDLHRPGEPLLMPNPWDPGSARLLASLGFEALATTSSGYAGTLGRRDGSVTRAQALDHAAAIVAATDLPVSADLENGFADTAEGVAQTAAGAVNAGLAGFSIEDYTGEDAAPIYPVQAAVERVAAAVEVAHDGEARLVVTAPPRTTCTGTPTSTTRSTACRPTSRREPTFCMPRGSRRQRRSATWSAPSGGRSTCWPVRACCPWPN